MRNIRSKTLPQSYLVYESLALLERGAQDFLEFDFINPDVYVALDFLQNRAPRGLGFSLYKEGLESRDALSLQRGLFLIKRHLGEAAFR